MAASFVEIVVAVPVVAVPVGLVTLGLVTLGLVAAVTLVAPALVAVTPVVDGAGPPAARLVPAVVAPAVDGVLKPIDPRLKPTVGAVKTPLLTLGPVTLKLGVVMVATVPFGPFRVRFTAFTARLPVVTPTSWPCELNVALGPVIAPPWTSMPMPSPNGPPIARFGPRRCR